MSDDKSKTHCPGKHDEGDVWCDRCGHGLPKELEEGPGHCPCCGANLEEPLPKKPTRASREHQ